MANLIDIYKNHEIDLEKVTYLRELKCGIDIIYGDISVCKWYNGFWGWK